MSKIKVPKIEELFDAGVHYGHQMRRWHPKMSKYIYAAKNGVHIIDLEKTEVKLKEATEFLFETAKQGKTIIFIGTKRQSSSVIELEAKRCGSKYVCERWLGGTITNFKIVKKSIDKLVDMMTKRQAGEYQKFTKKERLLIDIDIQKLNKRVGGLVGLNSLPGAIFVIDPKREKTAIHEARQHNIPVVGVVDTNCDPSGVDYVIPGNDDAIKSVALIVKTVADAIEEGYKEYAQGVKDQKEAEEKQALEDQEVTITPEKLKEIVPDLDKVVEED